MALLAKTGSVSYISCKFLYFNIIEQQTYNTYKLFIHKKCNSNADKWHKKFCKAKIFSYITGGINIIFNSLRQNLKTIKLLFYYCLILDKLLFI